MQFRIGPYPYRVRITEGPIKTEEGRPLTGHADREKQELLIAGNVLPTHRYMVLMHEITHAWLFHVPKPRTDEEVCELNALIASTANAELEDQGGRAALEAMKAPRTAAEVVPARTFATDPFPVETIVKAHPVKYIQPVETTARTSAHRAQCGRCELIVSGGSIVTGPTRWDRGVGGNVVTRSLYCAHCDHVQTWTEGVDFSGRPNGAVVDGPTFAKGEEVEQFLREHQEATGMVVV
jgi:hypothetical protein